MTLFLLRLIYSWFFSFWILFNSPSSAITILTFLVFLPDALESAFFGCSPFPLFDSLLILCCNINHSILLVSQAKGLASSSSIYCLVSVLDQAQGVLSEQKTKTMKGSSSPTWNATITLYVSPCDQFLFWASFSTVDDYFAGIAVQVYERHTIFSDKFLGVVRLKFNTERLENGDDEVDSWFTLSAIKGKSKISGEIHIKVIYGDGSKRKRPRASLSKPLSKVCDSFVLMPADPL